LDITNSATHKTIAKVPTSTRGEVNMAVKVAKEAFLECIQEARAWWDDVTKECAILRIAHSVNVISGELHQAGKAGK